MTLRAPGSSPSLVRRLILLAGVWSLVVLAIAGVLLSAQFQRLAVSRLDNDLAGVADSLYTRAFVDDEGGVDMPDLPDDRFQRGYSGRYWQMAEVGPNGELLRVAGSDSLVDVDIPGPPGGVDVLMREPATSIPYDAMGPEDQRLRAAALFSLSIPGHDSPLVFLVAEDRSAVDRDVRTFATTTAIALILLALFIIAGIWIQVRVGLQPLFSLRREVAEVRKGRADELASEYPAELAPLAEELNALVAHNREVVERQRTHVGNLAHALKTPISVMMTEAGAHPGPLADVVRRQSEAMHTHVEHHLRRARAAARAQSHRELTPVEPVIDELARTLERIFQEQKVEIDWTCSPDLSFQGERQDLMEIIGNVLENACKWSGGQVRIAAEAESETRLKVIVDDNGPGLPAARRSDVLKRGARLDEKTPGSGLGLAIVDDLARAYGGEVELGDAPIGGLRVEILLPRAES